MSGETLNQFTVSNVWAMDSALVRQLELWPMFRQVYGEDGQGSYFANHCAGLIRPAGNSIESMQGLSRQGDYG